MSAETVRRAAQRVRELAARATQGVWDVEEDAGSEMPERVVAFGMTEDGFDDDMSEVAEVYEGHDALYIAHLGPEVGAALADLLDRLAINAHTAPDGAHVDGSVEAEALAGLILGGAS